VDEDGTTVLQTGKWDYGATPVYTNPIPTKEQDDQYTYTFDTWSPEVVPVVADATYTAMYNAITRLYTVRFNYEDGSLIQSSSWAYGAIPFCTKPSKATDTEFSYAWAGWQPAVVPVVADAVYQASYTKTSYPSTDGLVFTPNADGVSCTLTNAKNVTVTDIVVPAVYRGLNVTAIGESSFDYGTATSVVLPSTVTDIGQRAFMACTALTSVTIPSSVVHIGALAFYGCSLLTSVVLPDSLTSCDRAVFQKCTGLTSITLSNSLTSLSESFLAECTSLTSVVIPEGVTSLDGFCFDHCTALASISLPDSLTYVDKNVFYACNALTYNVKDKVDYIGNATHPYLAAVKPSEAITNLVVADGCKILLEDAFDFSVYDTLVPDLTSVTLPDSLLEICYGVFTDTDIPSITLPDSLLTLGWASFNGCDKLTSIAIPSKVTAIPETIFQGCTALTSVALPSAITTIGPNAFDGDTALATMSFAGTIDQFTAITKDTTWNSGCTSLKSVSCSDGAVTL
jgi:hypothetical protein